MLGLAIKVLRPNTDWKVQKFRILQNLGLKPAANHAKKLWKRINHVYNNDFRINYQY